jgi:hypothetical protein
VIDALSCQASLLAASACRRYMIATGFSFAAWLARRELTVAASRRHDETLLSRRISRTDSLRRRGEEDDNERSIGGARSSQPIKSEHGQSTPRSIPLYNYPCI